MMIKLKLEERKRALLICILISCVLLLVGVFSEDPGVLGNSIILSAFIIVVPQLIFNYVEFRRLREIELRFPHFLRDLVEATRAGMPLHQAIIFTSHTDYGPLSEEVKRMANQLSWNVNIIKVLEQAKNRLKKSKTLQKVFSIILETYRSGGSIDTTLDSLSQTLLAIQETQKERKSMLNQYVLATYVISIVFIGIVVGINWLMVPVFESLMLPGGGAMPAGMVTNPCNVCVGRADIACAPCSIYSGICSMFGVDTKKISCYYLALFFSVSMMQAIAGGLVAGQIGEESVRAGIKHSLILMGITLGAFFILVRLGLLGG